jgi:lysophospholipase L1-like esterase
MHTTRPLALLAALAAAVALAPARAPAAEAKGFPLKDGDTWVMVGDSITAQHLHSNYFEAFCYARYPKLTFRFRNSGVGGDTIPKALARYDYDTAAWKPTVVSVELGMNDQGGFTVPQFMANMEKLTERIRKDGAHPVYLSASPINNGQTLDKVSGSESDNQGGNARLHRYALALKEYAATEKAPYADQLHALVDVWGKNKPNESLLNDINTIRKIAERKDLEGVEHLRDFLKANETKAAGLVSMKGDPVHPGEPGQLMMAAALLKGLGAKGFVSSATIDAEGKKVGETKGCEVTEFKSDGGTLSFDRLDESLPFPIPDAARPVLGLDPTVMELSQYWLKVTGLTAERYELKVNGVSVVTVAAQALQNGVNLTAYPKGPIAEQGKEVLAAVSAKEGLVNQWRNLSKLVKTAEVPAGTTEKLADLTKQVEAADAKIREAARPRKLHFELVAAK